MVFVSVDLVLVTWWWWWFKHTAATLLLKKIITPVFLGQNNNIEFLRRFRCFVVFVFSSPMSPTQKKEDTSKKNSFPSIRYRARAKVLEFKSKNKRKEKEAQSVR